MSNNYVIQIRPPSIGVALQAGIVVRDGRRFRFFSASRAFDALEGHFFDSPKKAEQAALERIAAIAARKTTVIRPQIERPSLSRPIG
jgi:hypothetical protein